MPKLDPISLGMLAPEEMSVASFRVIDAVQDYHPAARVASVASLFLLLCEHYGLCIRDALENADRLLRDSDKQDRDTTRAIKAYIQKEMS